MSKLKLLAVFSMISLSACSSSMKGSYNDPSQAEILDDRWNDTDARKTSEAIISQVLSRPWLKEFKRSTRKKPVVIVADIENRTDEHIDTKALTEFIRDELINSGKVRFLNNQQRDKLLAEIKYQNSGMVSSKTRKKAGKQIGADFMLSGSISSSVHSRKGTKTVTYQTALTLTNLETSEISWSGKKRIKKRFERSSFGW